MNKETVLLFTANGMGEAEEALRLKLATTFLGLISTAKMKPAKICFYTEGVRLACQESPVLELLEQLQKSGVELILCKTCLDYYGLTDRVQVGVVGGMPDIIEALDKAGKVIRM